MLRRISLHHFSLAFRDAEIVCRAAPSRFFRQESSASSGTAATSHVGGEAASVREGKGRADSFADLFETGRNGNEKVTVGRAWEAWELRHKSFQDLHALWYTLLKERTLLYSQKQTLKSQGLVMPQPHRIVLVRKSMCRIKQVLTERALAVEDPDKRWFYRKVINDM